MRTRPCRAPPRAASVPGAPAGPRACSPRHTSAPRAQLHPPASMRFTVGEARRRPRQAAGRGAHRRGPLSGAAGSAGSAGSGLQPRRGERRPISARGRGWRREGRGGPRCLDAVARHRSLGIPARPPRLPPLRAAPEIAARRGCPGPPLGGGLHCAREEESPGLQREAPLSPGIPLLRNLLPTETVPRPSRPELGRSARGRTPHLCR